MTHLRAIARVINNLFEINCNLNAGNVSSNTRAKSTFYSSGIPKTSRYGRETLRYLGPKLWDLVPAEIKSATSTEIIKIQVRKWIPINSPCRLCSDFIPSLGYI